MAADPYGANLTVLEGIRAQFLEARDGGRVTVPEGDAARAVAMLNAGANCRAVLAQVPMPKAALAGIMAAWIAGNMAGRCIGERRARRVEPVLPPEMGAF